MKDEITSRFDEWKEKYYARLVERGLEKSFAIEATRAVEVDLDIDPEECADEEISYME